MEFEDVSLAMVGFENGAVASVVNSLLSPRELSRIGRHHRWHAGGQPRVRVSRRGLVVLPLPNAAAAATLGKDPGLRDTTGALPRFHAAGVERRTMFWAASAGIDVPSNHAAQITRLVDDLLAGRTHQTTLASTRSTVEFVSGVYASALLGKGSCGTSWCLATPSTPT